MARTRRSRAVEDRHLTATILPTVEHAFDLGREAS
jgi:hypothetical protein